MEVGVLCSEERGAVDSLYNQSLGLSSIFVDYEMGDRVGILSKKS